MNMINQKWMHTYQVFVLLMACAVCGCAPDEQKQTAVEDPQDLRLIVHKAFIDNEQKAIVSYRQVWKSRSTSPATRRSDIELLAIAGQLIEKDPENSEEYSEFIKGKLESQDEEVHGSALSALARATDKASLVALIEAVSDQRMRIAIEATTALDYRLQSAKADPLRSDEVQIIASSLSEKCAPNGKAPPLEDFCTRNLF